MPTHKDELKRLQTELEKSEKEIAKANTDLLNAQSGVKQHTETKAALQRNIEAITLGQAALDKQRQSADKEREAAEKASAALHTRLEGLLSQEYRKRITDAIKTVDDEIAGQLQNVSDLKQRIAEKTQAIAAVKEEAAKCDARLKETQAELGALPALITSAQGRVNKLRADAQKAADSGRTSDAYILNADLKQALAELKALTALTKEEALRDDLVRLQAERDAKKAESDKASVDLEQLKRDLAAAEQIHQTKTRERDEAIKKKVAETP